jgi:hypothetical protein
MEVVLGAVVLFHDTLPKSRLHLLIQTNSSCIQILDIAANYQAQ